MKKVGFCHESTYNESKEWYTPRWIFETLGLEFDLDPASPGAEIVSWIPAKEHLVYPYGLAVPWKGRVWLNPPYGSDTPHWLSKLVSGYRAGDCTGIALVFARTDTSWFHDFAVEADAICFLRGRVHFIPSTQAKQYAEHRIEPSGGCGAGSMLLAYGKTEKIALTNFVHYGRVFHKNCGW